MSRLGHFGTLAWKSLFMEIFQLEMMCQYNQKYGASFNMY